MMWSLVGRNNRWRLFKILLSLFMLSLSIGCQKYAKDFEQIDQNEKIIIRFSHVVGEDTPKGLAARRFADMVKERSNGRIEVQVFSNGSLYKDGEEWDALKAGKVQMIAPAMSKLTDKLPELKIFDLPYYFNDLDEVHSLADGELGKKIFKSAEQFNLIPLAIWDNGFKQWTNQEFVLKNPEQFNDLTFRIMPSSILQQQYTLIGARTKIIGFNDVYQALQSGEIDGQENTISNIYTKKFYKVQNHLTISDHGYLGYLVLINKDFWENQLNDELRIMMIEVMKDVTDWQRNKVQEIEAYQLQLIKDCNCIEVEELTVQEKDNFRKHYKHLYNKLESELLLKPNQTHSVLFVPQRTNN